MTRNCDRRTLLKRLGAGGGVAALGSLAGCSSSGAGGDDASDGQSGTTVDMTDSLLFRPETITVSVGDTVVWENVGTIGHSVTAYGEEIPDDASYFASGGFDSEEAARNAYPDGDIPGGEAYEHTFEVPGTYEYFCIPHEMSGMIGTVVVEE